MKNMPIIMAVLCLCLFSATSAMSAKYSVYCANGKIEVDTRNLQQMKSARGPHTYMMSEFDNKIDADNFAKKLGGVGAQCPQR
ncbi:MAG: hypothetical protein J5861_00315 [Desulfovibrio sp.]|nr:hypothetical protein [Desulfovibrio sp.]